MVCLHVSSLFFYYHHKNWNISRPGNVPFAYQLDHSGGTTRILNGWVRCCRSERRLADSHIYTRSTDALRCLKHDDDDYIEERGESAVMDANPFFFFFLHPYGWYVRPTLHNNAFFFFLYHRKARPIWKGQVLRGITFLTRSCQVSKSFFF